MIKIRKNRIWHCGRAKQNYEILKKEGKNDKEITKIMGNLEYDKEFSIYGTLFGKWFSLTLAV
jgi:hypothetical protein